MSYGLEDVVYTVKGNLALEVHGAQGLRGLHMPDPTTRQGNDVCMCEGMEIGTVGHELAG